MGKEKVIKFVRIYLILLAIFITPKIGKFSYVVQMANKTKNIGIKTAGIFSGFKDKLSSISFGRKEILNPGIKMEGGTFTIGKAQFSVGSYYVGVTEVTVNDYVFLMENNPTSFGDYSLYPVTNVSWIDAVKYCNALSTFDKLKCVYTIDDNGNVTADFSKNGWRLPTKNEWYYAAASGGMNDNESLTSTVDYIDKHGWYYYNSDHKIHEVSTKEPNLCGIYDMRGNVSEWCWDYFWDWNEAEEKEYPKNYKGPETGKTRAICGGFYDNSAKKLNVLTVQDQCVPNGSNVCYGFRVVRNSK